MSELDTAAIRARVEAATPGPWSRESIIEDDITTWAVLSGDHGQTVCDVIGPDDAIADADAAFIAAARTDVPALLDALDAARAEALREFDIATGYMTERDAARAALAALRERGRAHFTSLVKWAETAPTQDAQYDATMTAPAHAKAAAEVVAQVINDEGGQPGSSLHSWRCEHPHRYGECSCVAETAEEIVKALARRGLLGDPDALAKAWDEGREACCGIPWDQPRAQIANPYRKEAE